MIGSEFIHLESINSTFLYLSDLLNQQGNLKNGLVVTSKFQEHGKGQGNNHWFSSPNKNILLSIYFQPDTICPSDLFVLNKLFSISIAEFLINQNIQNVSIKWPNDIYVEDSKIGGILIKNEIEPDKISSSIVGIGINLNEDNFPEDLPNPVSLKQITNKSYHIDNCIEQLLENININYQKLQTQGINTFDEAYKSMLYKLNKDTIYYDKNRNQIKGSIIGVDEFGTLKIKTENKILSFLHGEILFH